MPRLKVDDLVEALAGPVKRDANADLLRFGCPKCRVAIEVSLYWRRRYHRWLYPGTKNVRRKNVDSFLLGPHCPERSCVEVLTMAQFLYPTATPIPQAPYREAFKRWLQYWRKRVMRRDR